jgi:hypothetical protein
MLVYQRVAIFTTWDDDLTRHRLRLAMEKQNTPVAGWQFQMVFHVFHLERPYCNSSKKPSPMAYHK